MVQTSLLCLFCSSRKIRMMMIRMVTIEGTGGKVRQSSLTNSKRINKKKFKKIKIRYSN